MGRGRRERDSERERDGGTEGGLAEVGLGRGVKARDRRGVGRGGGGASSMNNDWILSRWASSNFSQVGF